MRAFVAKKAASDGQTPSLKTRALRLLARREYSRWELQQKLSAQDGNTAEEDIRQLLDELEALKLLSEERAAASFVRQKVARWGNAKILQELRRKGLAEDVVDAEMTEAQMEGNELARAASLLARKYAHRESESDPADYAERRREEAKKARFLQSRGFSTAVITKALRTLPRA